MNNKPILAFMQNMWLLRPETFWRRYHERVSSASVEAADTYRLEFIRRALFYRCITGQRLIKHFGEELIEQTVFEESTREVGNSPRQIFPADLSHIREAINLHAPRIVIAFGRIASDAVAKIWTGPFLAICHPAARQVDTVQKLKNSAAELRTLLTQ